MGSRQLSSPIGSNEPPKRREFNELHPKDQQIKQTKKLCIEKNWQCRIHDALPEAIRPRLEMKKGAKARVGDPPVEEEVWWNWSVELLKAVEELSSMTENELAYAQELLMIEVEQRQANPKSSQRKILELLLGDAQKVVDEQRKRLAVMYTTDVMQDQGETMDMQYDQANLSSAYNATLGISSNLNPARQQTLYNQPRHAIAGSAYNPSSFNDAPSPTDEQPMLMGDDGPRGPTHPSGDTGARMRAEYTPADPVTHLRTTEIKARAARLRAEALRVEAEAAELEVKARVLREQLDNLDD